MSIYDYFLIKLVDMAELQAFNVIKLPSNTYLAY